MLTKEELILLYKDHTIQEIAKMHKCSPTSIKKLMIQYNIPVKPRIPWNKGRKMTDQEREEMITAVTNAWTPERRLQQRQKQKEIWSNPELRKKNSEIAKSLMTEEHKKLISINTKKAMQDLSIKKRHIERCNTSEAKDKTRKVCLEKYGVPYPCMTEQARNASKTKSKVNKYWQELLDIDDLFTEIPVGIYSYDLQKGNTLIEVNPTYSHNSTIIPWFGNKKGTLTATNYHQLKSQVASNNGYFCFHIWDWDEKDKVVNYFKSKQTVGARLCTIKEIDINLANQFLNTYHFQNKCKNQKICIGLFLKDTLIGLLTLGRPRYNKNYDYELLRLCYHSDYTVIGGTQKMFDYFIRKYQPTSIISYCDNSKFSGSVYNNLGFTLLSSGKPSKHWYNIKTKSHITNNLLLQQGADRLLGTSYGKGSNNEDIMIKQGYVEVYDCGQSTYVWKR